MDILEHLGMKVPDIEGHGVIISRATAATLGSFDIDVFRNSQCSGQLRLVPCLLLGDGSLNPQVDRKVDRHLIQIF